MVRHVLVTVDDTYLDRMEQVVAGLRAAGLVVEDVLSPIGVVAGSCNGATGLGQVPGVLAVEEVGTKAARPGTATAVRP